MPIVSCVAHGSFYMLFPLVYVLKLFLFFFYVDLIFALSCIIGFLFIGFMSILCDFFFLLLQKKKKSMPYQWKRQLDTPWYPFII